MPAAVAAPLISAGVGAVMNRRPRDTNITDTSGRRPRGTAPINSPAPAGNSQEGGGGGGSSSNSSWSRGGTVIDQPIRDAAFGGANSFLQNGGFSAQDLSNMRARAVSPIRAAYSNANREVGRQRALQGGYSPNYTAAMSRMAREQSNAASEGATNAEAGIAQMVQQGKLGGLNALTSMYGNMPTFNESGSSGGSSSGGGGGSGDDVLPPVVQPKKSSFLSKFGSGLKKVGQVALPIALNAYSNRTPRIRTSRIPLIPRTNNFSNIGPIALQGRG